jgi:hypothetical protein
VRRKTVGDEWRFGVGGLDVRDGVSGTRRRQHGTDAGVQCRWRSTRAIALWSAEADFGGGQRLFDWG